MPEIHYSERYDTQMSITRPWQAPGGKSFLLRVLLWAAALYLLVFFFFGRGILDAYMDMFRAIAAIENAGESDAEAEALAMMSTMGRLYGSFFLVSVFGWFIAVSVETALHKNIFHGIDDGMFPLRFGRTEGRVLVTQLAVFACVIGVNIAIVIGAVLLGAIGGALGTGAIAILSILIFIGFIAALVFMCVLMIRLSPAAAYGVKYDRLVIFEMWKKTKGYGWHIFGSYLVAFFCGYVVMNVLMFGGMAIIFGDLAISGLFLGDVPDDPDVLFNQIAETFNKTSVKISLGIFMVVYMAASMFWYLHIWGIGNYSAEYISEREET